MSRQTLLALTVAVAALADAVARRPRAQRCQVRIDGVLK